MSTRIRWKGPLVALCILSASIWVALRGPQGIQALLEKHSEIRRLEERNAELTREVERRRDRIQRLEDSPSEQEMEIRKHLKLLKPGETTFLLPETPADSNSPTGASSER